MCDVDGTEELSIKVEDTIDIKEEAIIKVEEAIDIKDEIPEPISFPPVKSEHEVRLQGMCEVVAANAFRPFFAPQKGKCEITLDCFCFGLYCGCDIPFEIWIAILKRRDFLEVIAINGRIIFKFILKK
jgi:hypothetical protein